MAALKHQTLESRLAEDQLFGVLLHAVQQGGYEIGGLCHEQHELLFSSGKTAMSWGHLFIATVRQHAGGSVLQLSVGSMPGAPRALLDGRKNQKAADALLASIETALASSPPPSPAPVASFALMADGSTVPWTSGEFPGA